MARKNVFLLLSMFCLLAASATATRELSGYDKGPGHVLAARLEASKGLLKCWSALNDLKSCMPQIVGFLIIKGQHGIGHKCCGDILKINACWPGMFISIGFTYEEDKRLTGYCDAPSAPTAAPFAGSPISSATFI
ncbi:hypothetical protein QUC31_006295 [Theobroma cacao]|uniref:Prolamin-like domain-containing protein n=2 Tax=Theobroma cacao TaxID=3641 RepID=A0A061FQG7_THECC|nr:PREDICTED: egg cell-secreted protein 1.3 [Theobroma cacao]EOY18917.1 Uncharacterized protein TCM_043423 [Theobroma cacao]